jgi:hypothetical protein
MEQQKMVRVSVEIRSGAARFRVGVQAQSIRKALSMVAGRYPQGVVRVAFSLEHGDFFVRGPLATARVVGHERTREVAA